MADKKKTSEDTSAENYFENFRKNGATSNEEKMKECFAHYDTNEDGYLDTSEFGVLLRDVFCYGDKGYEMDDDYSAGLLSLFDTRKDGRIDANEFKVCWSKWLKQVMDPVSALLVVDVQNDFIDGTLAVRDCPAAQDGLEVVPIINNLLDTARFDFVVYTKDWHPSNHISFIENVKLRKLHSTSKISSEEAHVHDTVIFEGNPPVEQTLWPAHCIANTPGSDLHKDLKVEPGSLCVHKGTNPNIDSYSAFWDNNKLTQTNLAAELRKKQITDVYVCGLAYDVCVGATVLHALEEGFRTLLIDDACRGVDNNTIINTKNMIEMKGGVIVHSSEVPDLVEAKDRRPELGCSTMLYVLSEREGLTL